MNPAACLGHGHISVDSDQTNNVESFFDKKNYQWIIECLDNGYHISTDIISFMEDYCSLQRSIAKKLTDYSVKSKAKVDRQSTRSSYHTTRQAQRDTVGAPENQAQLIQTRCDAIQQVIDNFRQESKRIYPGGRVRIGRRHYKSARMENSFRQAHLEVRELKDELRRLRDREGREKDALRRAQIKCQDLELSNTTRKDRLLEANGDRTRCLERLDVTQATIARKENDLDKEQRIYQRKATVIYQECRRLEAERLNLIRETLIQFNRAVHTAEYSNEVSAIYAQLLSKIESE